ncbi:MAG: four helix bundle protein [Victivallales bacterium]|jgi:four helix bundle protein|nr:four helix bundle protein [Victivallales bacterium]
MDMEAESLDGRLVRYTAEIVALSGRMPSCQAAQEVATGLLQAVMGLLPRYHAACEMDSDRAFSRKIRQCRRMLRDARVWLSVIEKSGLLPHERIQGMQGDTAAMEATFSRIIHEIERRLI